MKHVPLLALDRMQEAVAGEFALELWKRFPTLERQANGPAAGKRPPAVGLIPRTVPGKCCHASENGHAE